MNVTTTAYESFVEDGVVGIRASNGAIIASNVPGELLKFMRYSAGQTIRITFDLDHFLAPILRLLPVDVLERLSKQDNSLLFAGHELYHYDARMFKVGKSRFYGIQEFWGELTDYTPTLEELQVLGTELLATLGEIGLANPRKLTSPIAVFEDSEWGKKVYENIPVGIRDIPENCREMITYAGKADKKEWVSNHAMGFFDQGEVFDFDQASSYPSVASMLPDLRDLQFWHSKELGDKEQNALIGTVRGSFTLDPDAQYAHCSPIMLSSSIELPCNPLGKLPEDCYTLGEVRFVTSNGLGTFKFKDGFFAHYINGVRPRLPFKAIMTDLYQKREISSLAKTTVKGIANALVGKLIETYASTGGYGPIRNDLYHALVLAGTRVQVARFLVSNQVKPDELLCVQTDGVKLTRDIPLTGKGMGSWVNKGSTPTILLSPYKVYAGNAKPYRLTYTDVVGMIAEHPLSQRYSKTIRSRITLKQAIRDHKDITRVGEIIDMPDSFDLIALEVEQNRRFKKLPKNGRALLNSKFFSDPIVL